MIGALGSDDKRSLVDGRDYVRVYNNGSRHASDGLWPAPDNGSLHVPNDM